MLYVESIVCILLVCLSRVDLFEIVTTTESETPLTSWNSTPGVIIGSWLQSRRGRRFQAFRGIRFAQPPVGPLRFQPPQPIYEYNGLVDARFDGPACPQPPIPGFVIDEDCLRINVYTPYVNTGNKLLPVIVFIHPGGFYTMSGRSDNFGPSYLMDRDVVLVTFNYRLGSLGFLSTGDELAPGNNGFKDQVVALRWVQRNIRAFGGDPGLVTLAGSSAGSISVMLHMLSPMSRGLFHRAISMSGSPIDKAPLPSEQRFLAVRQAQLLNCPADNSAVILDCLRTRSARDFGNSLDRFFVFNQDPVLIWLPVVEPDFGQERFLTAQPLDLIRRRERYAVPFIIGQTRDEYFWKAFNITFNQSLLTLFQRYFDQLAPIPFMLPPYNQARAVSWLRGVYLGGREIVNDTATAKGLGRLYGDAVIGFAVHRMANLMCRNSPFPVYYYEFDYIGNTSFYESPVTGRPVGVSHLDDLLYLFPMRPRFPIIPWSSPDDMMVQKMTAIWYNFARFGDPKPKGDTPELSSLAWPRMTPDKREYLRIGRTFTVSYRLSEDRFQVWDTLYPISYQPALRSSRIPDYSPGNEYPRFPDFSPGNEYFLGDLFGKRSFSLD